jgi:hypothetical protein
MMNFEKKIFTEKCVRLSLSTTEPIVLVILKSACFLIHALSPRDLKARGLKSARSADFIKFWLY